MTILLTNGKYYIAHNRTGAVIKVADIEQAQDFYSVERAINQRNRTPGKCAGYYYIDTEKNKAKIKRKSYSDEERKIIYNKSVCLSLDTFAVENHDILGGKFLSSS